MRSFGHCKVCHIGARYQVVVQVPTFKVFSSLQWLPVHVAHAKTICLDSVAMHGLIYLPFSCMLCSMELEVVACLHLCDRLTWLIGIGRFLESRFLNEIKVSLCFVSRYHNSSPSRLDFTRKMILGYYCLFWTVRLANIKYYLGTFLYWNESPLHFSKISLISLLS